MANTKKMDDVLYILGHKEATAWELLRLPLFIFVVATIVWFW